MFFVNKRVFLVFSVFFSVIIAFFTLIFALNSTSYEVNSDEVFKVVIDAGHGGIDSGVSGKITGVKESDLNLEYAFSLADKLNDLGIKTVLTRKTSAGLYGTATKNRKRKDMLKRKEIIESERPNLVISLHMNYYILEERRGAQAFFDEKNSSSKDIAVIMQNNLNELECNEKKYSALNGEYYVINCTAYPSVLIECGFLSNPNDEQLLLSKEFKETFMDKLVNGIMEYRLKTEKV